MISGVKYNNFGTVLQSFFGGWVLCFSISVDYHLLHLLHSIKIYIEFTPIHLQCTLIVK